MARYGSDFTTGRFTRRPNAGFGGGYDSSFGGMGRGLTGAQGAGWYGWTDGRDAQRGWDDFGPDDRFIDRGEASFGRDFGRPRFGHEGWRDFDRHGSTGFDRYGNGHRSPAFDSIDYGSAGHGRTASPSGWGPPRYDHPGYGPDRGIDRMSHGRTSPEMHFGGRGSHEYDDDLSDRLRRGWNRFRDEARSWMGRGYDRGW